MVTGHKSAVLQDEAAEGAHMQRLAWVTQELQGEQLSENLSQSEKQAGNTTQQQSRSFVPQSGEQKRPHRTLQHR